MSHIEVFSSIWNVVDAVNSCNNLAFHYPTDHNKQREIARGFRVKSKPDFACCAGAIDGMLLWIERPSEIECEKAKCGSIKFFCGRKHKFGLNLQGTCNADGKFLDVFIEHPALTSDYLSFSTSTFKTKLETPGFLANGLCIFGDNAYVNCLYMAMPFKNIPSGSKDDYNHYHSQLRIRIECAFGMLVNRWGILQKALSTKITLRKATSLAMCLCQLHNISCWLETEAVERPPERPLSPLAVDEFEIACQGGIQLDDGGVSRVNSQGDIGQLLDHGQHHFDDIDYNAIKNLVNHHVRSGRTMLRDKMLTCVQDQGLKRPIPKRWTKV